MTQPTDRSKKTDDAATRAANPAREQPTVETSRTDSQSAPHRSVQSAECSTTPGSKSPGCLPAANPPEEPRAPKSRPTVGDAPSRAPAQSLSPAGGVTPKGQVDGLRTPTQSLGIRQIRGDDNRTTQRQDQSSGGPRAGNVFASAGPGGNTLTRPTDPTPTREIDPIQPQRTPPTQPSHVVEPTIGQATGSTAASASGSSDDAGDATGDSVSAS